MCPAAVPSSRGGFPRPGPLAIWSETWQRDEDPPGGGEKWGSYVHAAQTVCCYENFIKKKVQKTPNLEVKGQVISSPRHCPSVVWPGLDVEAGMDFAAG